jgi:quercetin dioxygenase-like cupin family protein
MSRSAIHLAAALFCALALSQPASSHPEDSPPQAKSPSVNLETLLKTQLQGVEGTEVIVSRVTLPAHTSLPKHWHPGEEFGYVLEGTVTVWQEGKDDLVAKAGDVMMVPLKQIHTAITGDEGATILVFRVHEQGKPERVPVE